MKKILSVLLIALILASLVFSFVSCSNTLRGTYVLDAVVASKSYAFSGDSVTITVSAIAGDDIVYKGTYSINENEKGDKTITFVFSNADKGSDEYSGTVSFYKSDDGSYIKIGGIKYKKK